MLPRAARLHTSADFQRVTRAGVRAGRLTVVVHAAAGDRQTSRGGFVVSKAVGNAVVRNRVKRRLRHLAADRVATAAAPVDVVVRALPAASAQPGRLVQDVAAGWEHALTKLARRRTPAVAGAEADR